MPWQRVVWVSALRKDCEHVPKLLARAERESASVAGVCNRGFRAQSSFNVLEDSTQALQGSTIFALPRHLPQGQGVVSASSFG